MYAVPPQSWIAQRQTDSSSSVVVEGTPMACAWKSTHMKKLMCAWHTTVILVCYSVRSTSKTCMQKHPWLMRGVYVLMHGVVRLPVAPVGASLPHIPEWSRAWARRSRKPPVTTTAGGGSDESTPGIRTTHTHQRTHRVAYCSTSFFVSAGQWQADPYSHKAAQVRNQSGARSTTHTCTLHPGAAPVHHPTLLVPQTFFWLCARKSQT